MSFRGSRQTVRTAALLIALTIAASFTTLARDSLSQPAANTLAIGSVTVEGPLATDLATAILERQLPSLAKRCIDPRGIYGVPLFEARLLIAPEGRVVASTIVSRTSKHQRIRRCLQKGSLDLRFPRRSDQRHVTLRYSIARQLPTPSARELFGKRLAPPPGRGIADVLRGVPAIPPFPQDMTGAAIRTGRAHGSPATISTIALRPRPQQPPLPRRPGRLTLSRPRVDGPLSERLVLLEFERHRDQLVTCYERHLRAHPDLAGELDIELSISGSGRVFDTEATATPLASGPVGSCVVRRIRQLRFQRTSTGRPTGVRISLTFQPMRLPPSS